ncbi:MAG: hypothetical protein U5J98_01045 [Halobacteriales archaeon]|nr:hypothetical protein [Halobacteriales archaeon]
MNPRRLAVALVIVVVAASVGVGAATPGVTDASAVGTPAAATNTTPLGHSISSVMQSSTAQAAGAVENGMWAAAYANASNDTERRALVDPALRPAQRDDRRSCRPNGPRSRRRSGTAR